MRASATTVLDWKNNSSEALAQVCRMSGEEGVSEFRQKLPTSIRQRFDLWTAQSSRLPLDAAPLSREFFHFCPKTKPCGLVANWFLSMSPKPRIRRESVFLSLNSMAWWQNSKPLTNWDEVRQLISAPTFSPESISDDDRQALLKFMSEVRNAGETGIYSHHQMDKALCIWAPDSLSCLKTISHAFELVNPAYVTSDDVKSPLDIFALSISVPRSTVRILGDPRYARALQIANSKMLDIVQSLEGSVVRGVSSNIQIPTLEALLDESVSQAFRCSDHLCVERRKLDILLFYGSRGTSFLGFTSFLRSDFRPALTQYGAFSGLINYIEVLQEASGAKQNGFFTFPSQSGRDCLQAKPYHLIFARALTETLIHEGYDVKGAEQSVYLLALGYRIMSESPLQVSESQRKDRLSLYYQTQRIDLIFNAIGVLQGAGKTYALDPALTLSAMSGIRLMDGQRQTQLDQTVYVKQASEFAGLSLSQQVFDSISDVRERVQVLDKMGGLQLLPLLTESH